MKRRVMGGVCGLCLVSGAFVGSRARRGVIVCGFCVYYRAFAPASSECRMECVTKRDATTRGGETDDE